MSISEIEQDATDTAPALPVYSFPPSYLADAINRIEIANRRLAKAGIDERFTYETAERIVSRDTSAGLLREVLIDLTLSHPTIAYAGWTFIATLVHEEGGAIARTVPGQSLDGFAVTAKGCDHCCTSRARKDTFVVRHEDGRTLQVGSNCLVEFLGIKPTGLWALGYELPVPSDHERSAAGGDYRVPVRSLLACALAVSDHGRSFVTRAQAQFDYKAQSTADLVASALFGIGGDRDTRRWRLDIAAQTERILADEGDLLDKLIGLGANLEGEGDYVANMRVLASSEWIDPRNAPLLISVITAWMREEKRQIERAAKAEIAKGFLADEGARIADVEATVTGVRLIDNPYSLDGGQNTIVTLLAAATGHELKWFASGAREEQVGDKVMILRATVKKHDQFRGTDQTIITRAKLAVLAAATRG